MIITLDCNSCQDRHSCTLIVIEMVITPLFRIPFRVGAVFLALKQLLSRITNHSSCFATGTVGNCLTPNNERNDTIPLSLLSMSCSLAGSGVYWCNDQRLSVTLWSYDTEQQIPPHTVLMLLPMIPPTKTSNSPRSRLSSMKIRGDFDERGQKSRSIT